MSKSIYSKDQSRLVQRLVQARHAKKLSQNEVAKMLGRTQSYVSKMESGQTKIDVLLLKKLAEIYKQPVELFMKDL